jgi:aryl-alcohol dehydrogenase-like predicted oxidoreductase
MHGWDPLTPVEETLGFLDDAVHAGKIHYVGLSNFTGWQLQLTLSTAAAMGLQLPVTLQQQYSLVCRENEYEVVPAALHNDIGLLPWSPLASGFLTGKYEQDAKPPSGARMGSDNPFTTGRCGCSPASSRTGTPSTPSATSRARWAPRPARSPSAG